MASEPSSCARATSTFESSNETPPFCSFCSAEQVAVPTTFEELRKCALNSIDLRIKRWKLSAVVGDAN